MRKVLINNWQESGAWQLAKLKLIAFLRQRSPKFYGIRYIEICTQIDTALLRYLLADIPEIECIEENYRIVIKPRLRKLSAYQRKIREINRLRERAANHAIARGVPKTRAKLAAMGAFKDA